MRYTSTRDSSVSASFEEALCSGYAPDGGLFVPASLPNISAETLQSWGKLSYPDLSFEVLRLFISPDEVDNQSLRSICTAALSGFDDPHHAVPIQKVGSLHIAELSHGPTHCFKDLGMRGVINLLSYFATKRARRISLLVATTGDTGPAAVQAVSDANNPLLTLAVHYPYGQISNFQRKQLTTVQSPCVKVVAFEGGGDDMDLPIKHILAANASQHSNNDSTTTTTTLYTGVNSYNIGRPLMQMVHYVWSYLRVVEQIGQTPGGDTRVDVVLPTGAMGNMVSGYTISLCGIPFGTFAAGVNVNDITHRLIQTGAFHRAETMHMTLSEAINIQVPYNAERLLYYLTDGNAELIKEWYHQMDTTRKLDLPPEWLAKLQERFVSARVTDERMCAALRRVYESDDHYLPDPHTAVALDAAHQLGYDVRDTEASPVLVLSTASPCKFQEAVTTAVGSSAWETYIASNDFPSLAKAVLEKDEIAPIRYYARGSLEESQVAWEKQAWEILAEFEQLS